MRIRGKRERRQCRGGGAGAGTRTKEGEGAIRKEDGDERSTEEAATDAQNDAQDDDSASFLAKIHLLDAASDSYIPFTVTTPTNRQWT
jgi:hypothetical protein